MWIHIQFAPCPGFLQGFIQVIFSSFIMLSSGAIEKITSGRYVSHPLLQILTMESLTDDDNHFYCFLHDGTNLIVPCILPVLPDITLVKDSIILLENYSFRLYDSLNQFLIDISNYKLLSGVVTPQAVQISNQVVTQNEISPVNLQISIPDIEDVSKSPAPQDPLLVTTGPINTISTDISVSRPSSLPSALTSPPFRSLSGRRTSSMTDVSVGFVSASALYSKRFKPSISSRVYLINELLSQTSWTIHGRVVSKNPIGDLNKGGHWFYFEVNDLSGRVKINAFGPQCDTFYDFIKLHQVYTISRGKLLPARAPYNKTGHPIEISLTSDSSITELTDFEDKDFPYISSNFIKILDLKDISPGVEIDTIGICVHSTLFFKNTRRSVLIMDDSLAEIRVSVWTLTPENFNPPLGSILVIRRAKMTHKSYGRLLTVSGYSSVEIDPNIPEVVRLSHWYSDHGVPSRIISLSKGIFGDISLVSDLPSNIQDDTVIYTNLDITIDSITGQAYQACKDCSHKVKIYKRDIPVCEVCQDTEPILIDQLVLTLKVSDSSGSAELVAFTDIALEFLHKDSIVDLAEDLSSLLENFSGKRFKLNIKTRKIIYHGQSGHIQHSIQSFLELLPLGSEE